MRYPLPFAIDDVGVAGCTTTWSFAGLHSRPGPVREPRYFRASLGRYPRQFLNEDMRTRLAWIDRAVKLGGSPWVTPLSRRYRRLSAPGRNHRVGRSRRRGSGGGSRSRTADRPLARRVFSQLN